MKAKSSMKMMALLAAAGIAALAPIRSFAASSGRASLQDRADRCAGEACERDAERLLDGDGQSRVTGVEDVDGDSVPEIVVIESEGGRDVRVLVFSGAAGDLVDTLAGSTSEAREILAEALPGQGHVGGDTVVGDLNGDDIAEIVAGEWRDGELLVFSGADATLLYPLQSPDASLARGAETAAASAPCIVLERYVKSGDWRTLDWIWNASATAYFKAPKGAVIKVRYGIGWLGWDSQKQTLDGYTTKVLTVSSGASKVGARLQMKLSTSQYITYTYCGY